MKNILISWPAKEGAVTFLPYIWGVLKTATELEEDLKDEFNWLDPIYERHSVEELLKPYEGQKIDVLGLSCYLWNTQTNYRIAEAVKKDNPDCLVIAGGPEVLHSDPNYFDDTVVDVVIRFAGEGSWTKLLRAHLNGTPLEEIGGLVLPGHVYTDGFEDMCDLGVSPYIEQKEHFKRFHDHTKQTDAMPRLLMETARGCPYKCVFCTRNNKNTLTKIPIDRVYEELDFASNYLGIGNIFNFDCNFGVFKRDEDILDYVIEKKNETGFPHTFMYHVSKDAVDRNIKMAIQCNENGLMTHHVIGIQHTDDMILEHIRRKNPSLEEQKRTIDELHQKGIPSCCQVILGFPGDTTESFRGMFYTLMDMNMDEIFAFKLSILNNSRMADEDYLNEWEVKSVVKLTDQEKRVNNINNIDKDFCQKIVYSSKSYTKEDWIHMYLWCYYIQCLHFNDLTKRLAMYLNRSHGIPYREIYDYLYEEWFLKSEYYPMWYEHIEKFLASRDSIEEMASVSVEKATVLYRLDGWLAIELIMDDSKLNHMYQMIQDKYKDVPFIEDIVKYQKDVLIRFDYDRTVGKVIESKLNFNLYFQSLFTNDEVIDLKPGKYIWYVNQKFCGVLRKYPLNWFEMTPILESQKKLYARRVIGVAYTKPERICFMEGDMDEITG